MMVPTERSLWYYVGPGAGHNRIHKVIFADMVEAITIPYCHDVRAMDWTWLGPTEDFPKLFRFCAGPCLDSRRPV